MAFLKDELTGFVPTPQATDIIKMIAEGSSLLKLAKVEDMASEKKKFNVLVEGPGAYWRTRRSAKASASTHPRQPGSILKSKRKSWPSSFRAQKKS